MSMYFTLLVFGSLLLQTLSYSSGTHEEQSLCEGCNQTGTRKEQLLCEGCNQTDFHDMNDAGMPKIVDDNPFIIDFCILLNISLSECSCSSTPGLCEVETDIENFSQESRKPTYTRSNNYTVIYTTVTVLASMFGVIGNAAVLLISFKQRQDLSSCKLHIAELGMVNFIFSIVQIINVIPLYWTNTWIYSFPICKVIRSMMETGSLLTICFIITIAIERYVLIVHPLDSKFVEGKTKHITVSIIVLIVVATVVPYSIGLNIEKNTGRCTIFEGKTGYMALSYNWFVIGFYSIFPVCIISIAYGRIIKSLSHTACNTEFNNGSIVLKRMKTNHRIVRVTISILGIFIICTLPPRVIYIYIKMKDFKLDMKLYLTLTFIGYVLYPLQSTLNPILYSMVDHDWRKIMKKTWNSTRKKVFCTNTNNHIFNGSTRSIRRQIYTIETIQELDI